MPNDWSREEVEATVSDYFDMLTKELRAEPFNKADHNRNLQKLLHARTKGAIERKQKRLWRAGKKDLANRIEHVSNSQGDHLGFDILSFELDGRDRLIEVKTTRFGAMTPFFASRNEVEISESRDDNYQLYRLFNFVRQPKMFTLGGSLRQTCRLDAIQYSAIPKPGS
jgi:hypothetical protein